MIAMDDFDWAPMLTPPLTVISQNMDEIGRQAGRFVVDAHSWQCSGRAKPHHSGKAD
ncbi:MAG: hypothetical protein ACLR2M_04505 [Varibaculum sp.]